MTFSLRDATAGGGAAVALMMAALGFLGGQAAPDLATPASEVLGVASSPASPCPQGWRDTSTADEHTVVYSCSKDGWLVILGPDLKFQYATQLDTAGAEFVFEASKVTGWPR